MAGPLKLTFGIELEFVVRHHYTSTDELSEGSTENDIGYQREMTRSVIQDDIVNSLLRVGLEAIDSEHDDETPHLDAWVLEDDASIIPFDLANDPGSVNWEYFGFEVKSPKLTFNKQSLQQVQVAINAITTHNNVIINETCGMHVHIGNGTRGFSLNTLKNFAAFVTAFEQQIHSLVSSRRFRHENRFCRPLSRSHHLHAKSKLRQTRFILGAPDLEALLDIVTPHGRYYAYNFVNLLQGYVERFNNMVTGYNTIEFRQHEGTMDVALVTNWIKFVAGLVSFAHYISPATLVHLLADRCYDPGFTVLDLMRVMNRPGLVSFYRGKVFEHGIWGQDRPPVVEYSNISDEERRAIAQYCEVETGRPTRDLAGMIRPFVNGRRPVLIID